MSKTWKKWSQEDVEYIVAATQRGTKSATIAKKLGRSQSAVLQRACALRKQGVITPVQKPEQVSTSDARHGKRWSDEEHNTMVRLHESGWTYTAIGAEIGRTPKAVMDRLSNLKQFAEDVAPAQQVDFDLVVEAVSAELRSMFLTSPVFDRVVKAVVGEIKPRQTAFEADVVKNVVVELKPKMLEYINKAVQQEVRLATHVLEPEAKPTRAERRAERRDAKKQAKIDRLTQRIQEMSE